MATLHQRHIRQQNTKNRLQRVDARWYNGKNLTYNIVEDVNSGRSAVYNVYLRTADDPVTIGRELPLKSCRKLIAEYEAQTVNVVYMGDRRTAIKIAQAIAARY